jgi:hypothetical protein
LTAGRHHDCKRARLDFIMSRTKRTLVREKNFLASGASHQFDHLTLAANNEFGIRSTMRA